MEQTRPADIFQEALDSLWDGLGLEEKGWKRLKKGDFKKRTKTGLTYLIWFERRRYNYLEYEIGHGNVEVGIDYTIYQGDDPLYAFDLEAPAGGSRFQLLTEDLWLDHFKMIESYGPLEQLAEYRRQEELRKTPESKARQWMGSQILHFSHADYVDHDWAASRTVKELDEVVENHVRAKSSMTHGMMRTKRVTSSTFRSRIWKSKPTGPGI